MSDSTLLVRDYQSQPLNLAVRTKLNIRDAPSLAGKLVARSQPSDILMADQLVEGDTFLDNSYWYRQTRTGHFFWAGGVDPVVMQPPTPPSAANVARRADNTILPLNAQELEARYGKFSYHSQADGSILILDDWEAINIVDFNHALLPQMRLRRLRVHKDALPAFTNVFDAIQAAGPEVSKCLRTCAGTFVARHIGWDSTRPLSSHSWGIAIDLNTEWNAYGSRPQVAGMPGSVNELLPYFAQAGFAWGGHFSGKSRDGMHFELAIKPASP